MQVKMMKIMVIIMTMMIMIQRTKVNQKELDIESNEDFYEVAIEGDASADAAGARFNQHCFARWRLRRLPGIANHRRPGVGIVWLFSYAHENLRFLF